MVKGDQDGWEFLKKQLLQDKSKTISMRKKRGPKKPPFKKPLWLHKNLRQEMEDRIDHHGGVQIGCLDL